MTDSQKLDLILSAIAALCEKLLAPSEVEELGLTSFVKTGKVKKHSKAA